MANNKRTPSARRIDAPAGKPPDYLPDYRWVVEEQQIILRPEDLGLEERISMSPEGLTFAGNGDLLMAACSAEAGKTFVMRSADRGRTWKQQGVLEHRTEGDDLTGYVEGMHMTKSGRLVLIYYILNQPDCPATEPGWPYYIPGGNNYRFTQLSSKQWGGYSDDEGKTWRWAPMDISPFQSMDAEACSQIFEEEDGTLVATFRGHQTQAEMDAGISSNGVVRSHDGGLSWGDANSIAPAQPGSGLFYNENQVLPLPDGRWLCMMRLNNNNFACLPITLCRSYSEDRGRTWSYPVRTRFNGGEPGMAMLPDGAILCAQTEPERFEAYFTPSGMTGRCIYTRDSGERSGLLYEVSYDNGLTWLYWGSLYRMEDRSPEHVGSPIIRPLDEDTAIAVYHRGEKSGRDKFPELPSGNYGPQFIGASWLRKVPANSTEAAGLEYPEWLNTERALKTAIASVERVVTLPEEWHFQFDAADRGLAESWHRQTEFDPWGRMRIDEHWTLQGESRCGVAWYATGFELPETGRAPLLILFGAVDGICDIFIDSQTVGEQKAPPEEMWNRPFAVPLDKGLAAGRHTMVIRVKKDATHAGIHMPVCIVEKSRVRVSPSKSEGIIR